MSYMQSVSIIAYCMFPLFLTIVILNFMKLASYKSAPVRIASLTVASLWCMFGMAYQMQQSVYSSRRVLRPIEDSLQFSLLHCCISILVLICSFNSIDN